METVTTTEYDGCGLCFVGARRLSRKTDKTSSPERQQSQILRTVASVGGHVIGWADDWEVSGATDPMTRPQLGPWLRGEMGPYSGTAAATVDRIGRNVRCVLNTQALLTEQGRLIVTGDHDGIWDFSDPNQENDWMLKAWGSQLELRAIQKRNREETVRAREAGQPKQMPSYGYLYIRLVPMGKVDHVEIDPIAAEIIRDVAKRILSDETGMITYTTEAARLSRNRIPSPSDRRAELYGRKPNGAPWVPKSLLKILTSEAALGYLMHGGRPVLGPNGRPVRLAEPLWDQATHNALVAKTAPKGNRTRAPKSVRRMSGLSTCGNCATRLYTVGQKGAVAYGCTGRVRGLPQSQACRPAPTMALHQMDSRSEEWFLNTYGDLEEVKRIYDPGTGFAAQIVTLKADRNRLLKDREAGVYDDPEREAWFYERNRQLGEQIKELAALPDREPGMRMMPTGRRIADVWQVASDDVAKRELLAEFGVQVVLNPRGAKNRLVITGNNPYSFAS
ncbi:recombinase family protein [Kitasatospora sp. NPDC058032]|uniref:recombinase family protein n=1 Tax=Kitasatospora sp. NPDC058032 TaxID=3346307 RepID=UPI0036DC73A6